MKFSEITTMTQGTDGLSLVVKWITVCIAKFFFYHAFYIKQFWRVCIFLYAMIIQKDIPSYLNITFSFRFPMSHFYKEHFTKYIYFEGSILLCSFMIIIKYYFIPKACTRYEMVTIVLSTI